LQSLVGAVRSFGEGHATTRFHQKYCLRGNPLAAHGRVRIKLNDAGSIFPSGHKVRLAISTAYWPMIWPGPEAATVQIFAGTLDLPQRPPNAADAKLSPFPEPELIGHRYWTVKGADYVDSLEGFYKDLSIMGGFLLLFIIGAGKYSIDALLSIAAP
jgi:predicted acyl esterase